MSRTAAAVAERRSASQQGWSPEADAYLRANYRRERTAVLAKQLGVTPASIYKRAFDIGISTRQTGRPFRKGPRSAAPPRPPAWSAAADEYLRENYAPYMAPAIAKHLGKPKYAIYVRVRKLGISSRTGRRASHGIWILRQLIEWVASERYVVALTLERAGHQVTLTFPDVGNNRQFRKRTSRSRRLSNWPQVRVDGFPLQIHSPTYVSKPGRSLVGYYTFQVEERDVVVVVLLPDGRCQAYWPPFPGTTFNIPVIDRPRKPGVFLPRLTWRRRMPKKPAAE